MRRISCEKPGLPYLNNYATLQRSLHTYYYPLCCSEINTMISLRLLDRVQHVTIYVCVNVTIRVTGALDTFTFPTLNSCELLKNLCLFSNSENSFGGLTEVGLRLLLYYDSLPEGLG